MENNKIKLEQWFRRNTRKKLIAATTAIYLIMAIFFALNTYFYMNNEVEIQYNRILKIIDTQKKRIITNMEVIANVYSLSVDAEKILKNVVNSNSVISCIGDYKPSLKTFTFVYPEKAGFQQFDIDKHIDELKKTEFKVIVDNENICYLFPYFYDFYGESRFFEGILVVKLDVKAVIDELKVFLAKNEKISLTKENKPFAIFKTFELYGRKVYLIIDYSKYIYNFFLVTLLSMIVVVLISIIMRKLEIKHLNNQIIRPIKSLTEHMRNELLEEFDQNFEIEEFESLKNSFNSLIKRIYAHKLELEGYLQETTAMNEELSDLNKRLETYFEKLEELITVIARLSLSDMDEKVFFDKLLESAIKIVPEADYGSIFLFNKDKNIWKIISAIGHDEKRLKHVVFDNKTFIYAKQVSVVENIVEKNKGLLDDTKLQELADATKPISKSLLAPLKINNYVIGQIALDISVKNGRKTFSNESMRLVEALSHLASAFVRLKQISKEEGRFHKNVVLTLVKALEYYDKYTKGHSERVAYYATEFAEYLKLDKDMIRKVYWSSLLHDIGKFFIPQTVLNKETRLTDEEYEIVKTHSTKSYELLKQSGYMDEYAIIAKYHHERWDGRGYPEGLKGEEIPFISRIISLADSFDAMTTDRPYKKALSFEESIKEIEKNAGTQFDPDLAMKFVAFLKEESWRKNYNDKK
ncbi:MULTISPECIES: HD domain-containing phosphohydrolase [unclassified Marinitoga]|uniref:HD domain-containing phosphohydrolase n=1 Tax=unclassified Marinitoga TaxID=2640159 RepID=UPI000950EBF4|nr:MULTISPECIES: HD domain-containing phosphohydrolase [unclassified Marinitoga]